MNMNRACQAGWVKDDNNVSNASQHEDDGGDDEEGVGELSQGQGGDLSGDYAPPRGLIGWEWSRDLDTGLWLADPAPGSTDIISVNATMLMVST